MSEKNNVGARWKLRDGQIILQFKGDKIEVQAHRGTTGEFTGLIECVYNFMMGFLWKLEIPPKGVYWAKSKCYLVSVFILFPRTS